MTPGYNHRRATIIRPIFLMMSLLLATALQARADDLSDGLQAYRELDYDKATPLLERAAEDGTATAAQRASAALHLGIVHFALGAEDSARARFRQALALDPALTLPRDVSPKVREFLEQERVSVVPIAAPVQPDQPASATAGPVKNVPETKEQPANHEAQSNEQEPGVWSSPWLWGGVGAGLVALAVTTGGVLWWLSQQGQAPPADQPTCDVPSGSGCVRVKF